jgi:hypothetical protein
MADYKGIKGFTIPTVSSDPSNLIIGQMWYNSTTDTLKGATVGGGTWASGGNLNAARSGRGAAGTQTAGIAFGGWYPTTSTHASTEKYDGSTWTEVEDLNTARASLGGASNGSQTASLAFGGTTGPGPVATSYVVISESYNGTSWAEGNDLLGSKAYGGGSGTQVAALAIGTAGPPIAGIVEAYDGTSWTEVNDLNTGRNFNVGCGTQTASLTFQGGTAPPGGTNTANVELYNGTTWTEVNDLNTARNAGGGGGISTAAITFGGYVAALSAATESYNGTSWTTAADLATARNRIAGAGSTAGATAALGIGGQSPPVTPVTTNVEEWNVSDITTVTVTTS